MEGFSIYDGLFFCYVILCHLPYFISALNQVEPRIIGIPFTVWSCLIYALFGCFVVFFMTKNTMDDYDDEQQ